MDVLTMRLTGWFWKNKHKEAFNSSKKDMKDMNSIRNRKMKKDLCQPTI